VKIKEKDALINELQIQVNQLQQSGLALNLELHGVPDAPQIPLADALSNLAEKVGAPTLTESVVEYYRLPGRPPKAQGQRSPPGVVVLKFKDARARSAWLQGRNQLRPPAPGENVPAPPLTAAGAAQRPRRGPPPVRVYEQLTPLNKKLLYLTKKAAAEKGFKFVWTRDGKIFARKNETHALVRIHCEEEIHKKLGVVNPAVENN
jgi:hypothetical protein